MIPSLHQGVSQQDASLRKDSQCEEQINGYSNIIDGMRRRPPTNYIRNIESNPASALKSHIIIRDQVEKYQILLDNSENIRAFTLSGTEVFVKDQTDVNDNYLSTSAPASDLALITVSDTTFILNKSKEVKMDESEIKEQVYNQNSKAIESGNGYYEGFVFITKVLHGVDYIARLNVDGIEHVISRPVPVQNTSAPYTVRASDIIDCSTATGANDIDGKPVPSGYPDGIGLKQQLLALNKGFEIEIKGSLFRLSRPHASGDFTLEVEDSYGNETMIAYKGSAQDQNSLPGKCWKSARLHVQPEKDTNTKGGFYAEYITELDDQEVTGVWQETRGFNLYNKIDSETFPHILESYVYDHALHSAWGIEDLTGNPLTAEDNGTPFFLYKAYSLEERLVGDEETAPTPSFVGKRIEDIFFYRNRLGILTSATFVLSRSGKPNIFWPTTVTRLLDDDPIDVTITSTNATDLQFAVTARKKLYGFSVLNQFVTNPEDNLTWATIRADPATNYEIDTSAKPVAVGKSVFFLVSKGEYTGVREYVGDDDSEDALDVTEHIPQYLPKNISKMVGSANEDILLLWSADTPNTLYINKFYWVGEEKVQNSWSKWIFDSNDRFLDFIIVDGMIHLSILRPEGIVREDIDLKENAFDIQDTDNDLEFQVHLDKKWESLPSEVSYDSNSNITTIASRYPLNNLDSEPRVVVGDEWSSNIGTLAPVQQINSNSIEVLGDYTTYPLVIGVPVPTHYKLSIQYIKENVFQDRVTILTSKITLLRLFIKYNKAGRFKTKIKTSSGEQISTRSGSIGTSTLLLGRPQISSGIESVPIFARATDTEIEVIVDDHLPASFQSMEWTGRLKQKTTRRY